jgi:hypothetical protein
MSSRPVTRLCLSGTFNMQISCFFLCTAAEGGSQDTDPQRTPRFFHSFCTQRFSLYLLTAGHRSTIYVLDLSAFRFFFFWIFLVLIFPFFLVFLLLAGEIFPLIFFFIHGVHLVMVAVYSSDLSELIVIPIVNNIIYYS